MAIGYRFGEERTDSMPAWTEGMAWQMDGEYFVAVSCNSTGKLKIFDSADQNTNIIVYDVTYTAVGGAVTSLSKRRSNSTVTGIASMLSPSSIGEASEIKGIVTTRLMNPTSLDLLLAGWELGVNQVFAPAFAIYTLPVGSLLAQKRVRKLITALPVSALWLLVPANTAFAFLAITLAAIAWRTTNTDIQQVRARLGIPGLAAGLFEKNSENRVVASNKNLFHENDDGASPLFVVGVEQTVTGGMAWSLREKQTGQ